MEYVWRGGGVKDEVVEEHERNVMNIYKKD